MSKQEEIREGMRSHLKRFYTRCFGKEPEGMALSYLEHCLENQMIWLASQGVAIKADRELPVVCELEPDVDACFGQEVCCEILPKYIKDAGSVSNECYREIIGLAYALADTIAKTQRDFNAKAGYTTWEPLIEEVKDV